MPEDDNAINFIAKVHEVIADTDTLIEINKQAFEQLEDPEALQFVSKTIETLISLKILVTELMEHSAEVNDKMESFVQELQSRIKKK